MINIPASMPLPLRILREVPYAPVAALAALLGIFAIIAGRHFRFTFATFLYAVVGLLWRHFIVDLRVAFGVGEGSAANQLLTLVYHAGNAVLFFLLLRLLTGFAAGVAEVGF